MAVSPALIEDFNRDGYVSMPDAISPVQLKDLTAVLDEWTRDCLLYTSDAADD